MAATMNPEVESESQSRTSGAVDYTARLSAELGTSRKRGEVIRVKRISPHNYRVNYMSPMAAGQDIHLTSYTIVSSKFLFVDEVDGQLQIVDKTLP